VGTVQYIMNTSDFTTDWINTEEDPWIRTTVPRYTTTTTTTNTYAIPTVIFPTQNSQQYANTVQVVADYAGGYYLRGKGKSLRLL
jgi:hypothetical protein